MPSYKSVAPVFVEYASTGGPFTASPTWNRIETPVEQIRITRGKTHWLQTLPAGTATLQILSLGRQFDPNYSGKATGWQLGRRVRISTVIGGNTYYLFSGHIEDIEQVPSPGRDDRVLVTLLDQIGACGQFQLQPNALGVVTETLLPNAWWHLASAGVQADASGNSRTATATGTVGPPIAKGAGNCLYNATLSNGTGLNLSGANQLLQVSFMVQSGPQPTQLITYRTPDGLSVVTPYNPPAFLAFFGNPANSHSLQIQAGSTGYVDRVTYNGATAYFPVSPFDGRPHHVFIRRNGDNLTCWVDGVAGTTASGAGTDTDTVGQARIFLCAGAVTELAVWTDTVLTSQNISDLATAAATAWSGDSADARIQRICNLYGVPVNVTAATVALGPFTGGTDLASYLQQVAAAEDGRCYAAGAGPITQTSKLAELLGVSGYRFDDSGSFIVFEQIRAHQSRRDIVNYVTVNGPGVSGISQDTTSISSNGRRAANVSTALTDQTLANSLATKLINQSSTAAFGGETIKVRVGNGSTHDYAGAIEIGSIITRSFTPSQTGAAWSGTFSVVGIQHQIDGNEWFITYTLVPQYLTSQAPYNGKTPFIWGTSVWDGGTVCWAH